jgi:hypothetical protein
MYSEKVERSREALERCEGGFTKLDTKRIGGRVWW